MASYPSSDDSFWRHSSGTWYPNMTSQVYTSQPQLPPLARVADSSPSFSETVSSSGSSKGPIYPPNSHSSFGVKVKNQDQVCPDGGSKAWAVIVGSAFLLFSTLGFQTCIGLFQLHLSLNQLYGYSYTATAWIPSLYIFSSAIFAVYIGDLFDKFGARYILGASSIVYFLTFILLARCTQYWHFILCLGLLGGLSSATIIAVAQGVIGHWFKERQGMASALAMAGASLGGIVLPLVLYPLLESVGWVWAMQGLAFIMGALLMAGNILCESRVRATCPSTKIDLTCFQDGKFAWLTASVFGFELLIISAIGIGPSYAYSAGYGKEAGYFLVMTASIGATFGRLIPSIFISDRVGRFNTLLITSVITLFLMLILWLPFGEISLIALHIFTFFYGFGTGSFVTLAMGCVGQICAGGDVRKWLAALDIVVSIASLVAIPISSALLQVSGKVMVGFLTSVLTLSIIAVTVARAKGLGGQWFSQAKI